MIALVGNRQLSHPYFSASSVFAPCISTSIRLRSVVPMAVEYTTLISEMAMVGQSTVWARILTGSTTTTHFAFYL